MKYAIVLLSVFVVFTSAAPVGFFDSDDDSDFFRGFQFPKLPDFGGLFQKVDCQSLGCSSDTNSCSKKVETSKDKKTIDTTVKCFKNGQEIDQKVSSQPNADPNAQVSEYSYFGSFTGDNTNINIENHTRNVPKNKDDQIETFDR